MIQYKLADTSNVDSDYYICAVCSVPIIHNRSRRVPDKLCQQCYREFSSKLNEPWLVYLIGLEKARWLRLWKLRRKGITRETISFEQYMFLAERDGDTDEDLSLELETFDEFDDSPGEDAIED